MTRRRQPSRRPPPGKREERFRREMIAGKLRQAEVLLERGRAAEAVALLEPAIEEHPRSAHAHYLLGYAYAETGNVWRAIAEGERALALGRDPGYGILLVRLYAQVGFRAHAMRAYRATRRSRVDISDAEFLERVASIMQDEIAELADEMGVSTRRLEQGVYHMEEGELALQRNDWEASMAASRRAIRDLGDWPPPHNNLSLALCYSGQPEEAIAEVRHVLSVMPDNIHALSNGIRFLAWAGREDEARELWIQLRTIETEKAELRIKIAEAAAVLGLDEEVYRLLAPIDQAELSYEAGRGLDLSARLHLAIAEANLGRRGARRKLRELQGTHPVIDEVLDALEAGKPGPGWADRYPHYHSSEMLSRDDLDELVGILEQQERVGEDQARREIAQFAQHYPQAVLAAEKWIWEEGLVQPGLTMLKLLDTPAARAALRRFGLSQAGEDAQRLDALQALIKAGEIGEDEPLQVWLGAEWQKIVMRQLLVTDEPKHKLDPVVIALLTEAMEASAQGDDQRAEALYQRVLEIEPRNREAHLNLGTIYLGRDKVEHSKDMLRRALEIDPLYVHARCNLALLALSEGDTEAAEAMIRPLAQVTRFDPGELALYTYVQAEIRVAHGEYDAARKLLEMSLEMVPGFEPSAELLVRLRVSDGLKGFAEEFSESLHRMQESSRKGGQSKRLRLQRELTTPSPSLAEALPIYLKNALTAMARLVMPHGGWSTLNKAPLAERIAETLPHAGELARVVGYLDEEPRAALREVVAAGGTMPWTEFDARYGNDLEESPDWDYHPPKTVMGQLRLHGMLVETTVNGELLVAVPAELRPALNEILG